jgi:hypothetical protein
MPIAEDFFVALFCVVAILKAPGNPSRERRKSLFSPTQKVKECSH